MINTHSTCSHLNLRRAFVFDVEDSNNSKKIIKLDKKCLKQYYFSKLFIKIIYITSYL